VTLILGALETVPSVSVNNGLKDARVTEILPSFSDTEETYLEESALSE